MAQGPRQHAAEEQVLRLDATKAAAMLHWNCRLPITEALRWVADCIASSMGA